MPDRSFSGAAHATSEATGAVAHPTFMDPVKAAEVLRSSLRDRSPVPPLTVADAAAKSGLPLRDAENGLKRLSSEYRGQLRVTNEGEIVYVFPTGFTKPWEARDARRRVFKAVSRAVMMALRFLVRAWVTVVLLGYAAIFIALLLAMTFARQGNDNNSRRSDGLPGGALGYAFFRVLGDAFFWTFHPWSPFSVYSAPAGWGQGAVGGFGARAPRAAPAGGRVPFYERVNRFFFGPPPPSEDPRESERLVLAAIRAGKGRIGLADVMRVTGLPREQADPMMSRLMLDYEGDVDVSEDGGIVYRFQALRKTALDASDREPPPAWARAKPLPPLTGNSTGANFAIAAINGFNLLMGVWAIDNNMTIENVMHLFDRVHRYFPIDTGMPIALGLVPLVFSALLFLLPLGRMFARPWRARAFAEESGRLAVLREVLERVGQRQPVTDTGVAQAWQHATGRAPADKQIDKQLVALGGDVAILSDGQTRWRFADLETEASAVQAEREAAAENEARLGEVVFATDKG